MDKSVYDYLGEKYGGQWCDVVGYEGLYCVSSDGRVASLNYNHTGKEKLLKPNKHKFGYSQFRFNVGDCPKVFSAHRLVAEAFIPNPDNKPEVDHINAIPTDNNVENLRWVTHKENMNNPLSKINHSKGAKLKPVIQISLNGDFVKEYESISKASEFTGYIASAISYCCKGKRKTANGFRWLYKEDYEKLNEPLGKIEYEKRIAKPIVQLTLSGDFVCEYYSIYKAAEVVNCSGLGICNCCKGKRKSAYGYKWLYADDYYKSIEKQTTEPLHKQTPVQLSLF